MSWSNMIFTSPFGLIGSIVIEGASVTAAFCILTFFLISFGSTPLKVKPRKGS
jgi:hypothetical protein